jgi:hypothetical protein
MWNSKIIAIVIALVREVAVKLSNYEYMQQEGLWRRYINITITTLDIIHRPVFYLKT